MAQDLLGSLKIAFVVLLSSAILGALVGFFEGAAAGKRTFVRVLPLAALVGLLQIVEGRYAPWLLGAAVAALAGAWIVRRRFR